MKKVFVSFDYDNDARLKDLFAGQAKNPKSPFKLVDHSLKEAAPDAEWEKKAEVLVKKSDIVVVLVGDKTSSAHGVKKEVAMARRNNIPVVQVTNLAKANRVEDAGRLYKWTWENLVILLT